MNDSQNNKSNQKQWIKFSNVKRPQYMDKYPQKSITQINKMIKKQFESSNKKATRRITPGTKVPKTPQDGQHKEMVQPTPHKLNLNEKSAMKKERMMEQAAQMSESMKETPKKQPRMKKIRKLMKPKAEGFKQFQSFYKKRLHEQHPKWNYNQINVIIKLLWRKKASMIPQVPRRQSSVVTVVTALRTYKILSGRTLFGKEKRTLTNMDAYSIKELWNTFPRQTKLYWTSLGMKRGGFNSPKKDMAPRITFKAGPGCQLEPLIGHPLSFMNKVI